MRKDVKLGLAIGAILLAVVIVWAAAPRHAKKPVVVVTLPTPTPPPDQSTTGGTTELPAPPPEPTHSGSPTTHPDAGATAGAGGSTSDGTTNWAALLRADDVQLRTMMGQSHPSTVTPAVDHHDIAPDDESTQAVHGGGMAFDPTPTTHPATIVTSARPRTHTVQSGETLAAIAKSVYGKSGMYLAIEKANPNVNPNRLKIGTVLTLPSAESTSSSSDSSSDTATPTRHARASADSSIDSTKQYKVQPGDSLHKISEKLYGTGARADELYTTNKEIIGDDPAKLKVGEVLTLPEPPTASASR